MSGYHFRNTALLVGRVLVEFTLISLDVLDHKVLTGELYVVGKVVYKLVVTCECIERNCRTHTKNLRLPNRVPLSGENSARTLCTFDQ
jgi:hypothetical protein